MLISSIRIRNYRGIKEAEIKFGSFNSIIGKNDTGKTSILSAISSFFDLKNYPISNNDFNNIYKPIEIEVELTDNFLKDKLIECLKSKLKKEAGLEEYVESFLHNNSLKYRKSINFNQAKFSEEKVYFNDFEREDLQNIYFKSDEEISKILAENSISVPIAGKGRNSKYEKIKQIKSHFANEPFRAHWVNDEFKISTLLPDVEFFKADYGLEADTKFKTQSVSEILSYFDRENSLEDSKLKKIENEIFTEMQSEAKAIKHFMQEYATNLVEVEIRPLISWKDIIKSVDVSFKFDNDEKLIPMTHKGAGYRRIFMVARFRYLAEKNRQSNIIYLIEEPETFLHPSAQQDLIEAFKDLSETNQIFITTHSPVFTGSTALDSVILCTKTQQSNYEYRNDSNEDIFLKKVVDELGIKPSFNLMDNHEKIVFVEGNNDILFFDCICKKLEIGNLLGNPKILVLPCGGKTNVSNFVDIDYFSNSNRYLYLILDSDLKDGEDEQARQHQQVEKFISNKTKAKGYVLKKSCIENYYHPRAMERVYSNVGIQSNTLDFFDDNSNVKEYLKQFKQTNNISRFSFKNNHEIFKSTTKEEWLEILERELIEFLDDMINS